MEQARLSAMNTILTRDATDLGYKASRKPARFLVDERIQEVSFSGTRNVARSAHLHIGYNITSHFRIASLLGLVC